MYVIFKRYFTWHNNNINNNNIHNHDGIKPW